jgi:hypothetical protein
MGGMMREMMIPGFLMLAGVAFAAEPPAWDH